MTLSVSSPAFEDGQEVPAEYTCQGQDISPPLSWEGVPRGTQSLALIMDDPDAPGGVFTHWVLFNIPPESCHLPEAMPTTPQLSGGILQGRSDFGRIGYGGPCPPPGPVHHYRFVIYALDKQLGLKTGSTRQQVLDAIAGHILAQGQLVGTYRR